MEELIYSIDWEQVKNRFDIFMWGDPSVPVVKGWFQIVAAAVGLIVSGAQAISAAKRRKTAKEQYKKDKAALDAAEITNPYENLENPYADLTVNQKQANFAAQQQQQGLANQMQSLRGAAGASGITSFAQSIANQQSRNLQGISGAIGQQEARNQQLSAQGRLQVDAMKGQGAQGMEMREGQRRMGALGMSQMDVAMEQQRMNAAIGAVGQSVGQLGGAIADQNQLNTIAKDKTDAINKLNIPLSSEIVKQDIDPLKNISSNVAPLSAVINPQTADQNQYAKYSSLLGTDYMLQSFKGFGPMGYEVPNYEVPSWLKTGNYNDWKNDPYSIGFNIHGKRIN